MADLQAREPLIFELSRPGRGAVTQYPPRVAGSAAVPAHLRRAAPPALPEVSELQVVRHFTRLSQMNFSIDTHFYPLGSCTMKYNPKACNTYAMLPEFLSRHPLGPEPQGFLACMYELQEMLQEITGMQAVSLTPMAGAQGEFAGVAMIRAYHRSRNDAARTEIIVPQAAHGTNPATATMCGFTVKEIPCDANGDVDIEALKAAVSPATAGIMLTNPSTLGVFEHKIVAVARIVHDAGGLSDDRVEPVPVDLLERGHVPVAHQVRDRLLAHAPCVHDGRERVPHAVGIEHAEPGVAEDDFAAPPETVAVELGAVLAGE